MTLDGRNDESREVTYEYRGTGIHILYRLEDDRLLLQVRRTLGDRADQVLKLGELRAEPEKVFARDVVLRDRIILSSVVVFFVPVAFLVTGTDFGLLHYATAFMITWFLLWTGISLATSFFVRRIEWAVFHYRSGPVAMYVGKTPGRQTAFDEFVSEVNSRISKIP